MHRFTDVHDPLDGPPAHVQAEVDAAWERSQDLVAGELELHFSRALAGHIAGELRLPGGGDVIGHLSASEALALACGDAGLALAA